MYVFRYLCNSEVNDHCWIGLNDINVEGVFEWIDGTTWDYGANTSGNVISPWGDNYLKLC